MFGRDFLPLPVHAGGALVVNLHPVHAKIALARLRTTRGHAGQSNESSRVLRPALQNRKIEQRKVVALNNFFARSGRHRLRKEFPYLGEQWEHLQFVEKSLRGFYVHEHADAVGDLIERIDAEGEFHARFRTELIDQHLRTGMTFYILKQKRGAAGRTLGVATLRDAVGDLGDFKNRVSFGLDALQFAGALQRGYPLAKVVKGQRILSVAM